MAERSRGGKQVQMSGKARHNLQLRPKKKHKDSRSSKEATEPETNLTELRKNIRGLEKLLAHDAEVSKAILDSRNTPGSRSMPSHIRREKERALAGYKHDLDLALSKRKNKTKEHSRMISKYHAVRFFERKKAERNLKRAKAALEAGEGSEEAVMSAQSDLNYTLYLPLSEKYVSLWPQNRGDDPDKVREDTAWKTLRDVFLQAQSDGLNPEQIEENLLKIRDDGWFDTFGMESLATKPPHHNGSREPIQQNPVEHSKKVAHNTNIKADREFKTKIRNTIPKEDVEMESDSDGFFET